MKDVDELALVAREQGAPAIMELWEAVRGFAFWFARRYKLDKDDAGQAAQEALLRAVRGYDPDKGPFLTAYKYALHGALQTALWGGRSEKIKQDPLHRAESLDAPATEDGDTPLRDLIADKTASDEAAAFEAIEARERAQAVRDAIAQLTEPEQAVIFAIFFQGMTQDAAAAALRISAADVRKTESAALRRLRRPDISRKLQSYL